MFVRVLSTTLVNVTITYHVTRRIFLLRKIFHRNLNEAISTSEIVLFKFLRKIVLKKKLTITFSTFKVYSVRSIVSSLEAWKQKKEINSQCSNKTEQKVANKRSYCSKSFSLWNVLCLGKNQIICWKQLRAKSFTKKSFAEISHRTLHYTKNKVFS